MSLRTSLLAVCAAARSLSGPAFADIRTNQLTIRTRTWSGARVGAGTSTDADLVLPSHFPIRYLTAQQISSAAGRYEVGDLRVDHITPSNGGSVGYTVNQLNPPVTARNVEVIYILTGEHAGWYSLIDFRSYRPFTYQLIIRRRATPP